MGIHYSPCILMPQKKDGGQCAREIKQEVDGL